MKKTTSLLLLLVLASSAVSQPSSIPVIVPKVIRTIPHDTKAFTQGLFYYKGLLYESTGLYGQSSLRVIDPKDGTIIKNIPVADIFAEGCARMDSFLVQLSWREKAALVYSLPSLKYVRSFSYDGEGWGLTSSAASFYMSNGSDTLFIRNKKFSIIGKMPVTNAGKPLLSLNELEYVKGLVYANVWFDKSIYLIQPKTGKAIKIVDCTSLVAQNASQTDQDVLNGIAYNNVTGTFYLTGKNWRYIFEVRL
ncbi:MAG TPA: glutaminyl-peptide cyclotransferase [Chitinivibrionales bacterium]|nr:glutaminyl-peptide cyclotransferase [Chitinivibrionales bacterium]